jgi:hypothetical protein
MLINYEKKLIVLTPYKNYSTTIESVLSDMGWDKIHGSHPHIEGENIDCKDLKDLYYKHNNVVSERWTTDDKYKVILPVRNPYDRVKSMWKYAKKRNKEIPFSEWFFEKSKCVCCLPVTRTYKYDYLVKVENLIEDFESLDIKIDFIPHLNKSVKNSQEFTDIQKEQIFYLHYEDFKNGNYLK